MRILTSIAAAALIIPGVAMAQTGTTGSMGGTTGGTMGSTTGGTTGTTTPR